MVGSVLDLFRVGIGPSSSHTVAPMRAAKAFAEALERHGALGKLSRVVVDLYGSLAATGAAHGTLAAVVLGLEGEDPAIVDLGRVAGCLARTREQGEISLLGRRPLRFDVASDVVAHRGASAGLRHPNAMRFHAFGGRGEAVGEHTAYSIGGGFLLDERPARPARAEVPYRFRTGADLLRHCAEAKLAVSAVVLANELSWRDEATVRRELLERFAVMRACVQRGLSAQGPLPGWLRLERRAPELAKRLSAENEPEDPLGAMDWVDCVALAVSEENAAGGRVVTAPTNGAAGIVPAVLDHYRRFVAGADDEGVVRFLLVAGAVGWLCKEQASISGAEVGCQGEVGSACAMAAAGLAEVLGGTPPQVENAAEIGVEHNLGLTCDPVGGFVQVPCIERNAMAAVKAVNAARLALGGDGRHVVSLDKVLLTMRQTGEDMLAKYKETSLGGLAVNLTEC